MHFFFFSLFFSYHKFLIWGHRDIITIKAIIPEVLDLTSDKCDHLWPSCDHIMQRDFNHYAIMAITVEFCELNNEQFDQVLPPVTRCDHLWPSCDHVWPYYAEQFHPLKPSLWSFFTSTMKNVTRCDHLWPGVTTCDHTVTKCEHIMQSNYNH